jgi:2',3'-cyclic-nucleotide 2'-phosphodiesterase (5'-nucleotidase family)
VLLDSGNFSDNPTPEGDAKTRALLEGMGRIGYAAVGLAERDLVLGYDDLMKKANGVPFDLVSTNFVRKGTNDPVFKPYTVVEARRGGGKPPIRVGIMSVVRFNPVFLKAGPSGSNVSIAQPAAAVKRYLAELREKSDVVVLLVGLSSFNAHEIVRDLPGVDFVFGAYGATVTAQEDVEGAARIVYTGNQGKRIGETRVFLDPKNHVASQESYVYFLTARYPDDPDTLKWVQSALRGTKPAESAAPPPAAAPAPGGGTSR